MPNGAFACGSRCQNAHIHKLRVLTFFLHVLRQFEHPRIPNLWLPNVGSISTSKMPRFYGDFITLIRLSKPPKMWTPGRCSRPPKSNPRCGRQDVATDHPNPTRNVDARTLQPEPPASPSHPAAAAIRQPEPILEHLGPSFTDQPEPPGSRSHQPANVVIR